MRSEHAKGKNEIDVFCAFVSAGKIPYALSAVVKRVPRPPDMFFVHESDGPIAFELVEICDPRLAEFNATVKEGGAYYMRTADPSAQIVKKKLSRKYQTNYPIELLCYTAGRVVSPANFIISTIRPLFRARRHAFCRAWLLSRGRVHEVWKAQLPL